MIQIVELEDPRNRENFLSEINPEKDCFLVSDIKSKIAMEQELLQKEGKISGQAVLRMKDFLKDLFLHTHSHWHIVPKAFLQEFFLKFTNQHTDFWVNHIQDSQGFFSHFDQFLPVLSHPESHQIMRKWLKEKKHTPHKQWGRWYRLSEEFFSLIQEKKWIHEEGIKGLLLNELPNHKEQWTWPHQIIVDLGIHFDFCEQDILKTLSSLMKVTVLIPKLQMDIFKTLPPYDLLKKTTPPSHVMVQPKKKEAPTNFFKMEYETTLKESKSAIHQIRKWLDQGVPASDIAVLAPDMEDYWFCLQPYLEKENIMVRKSVTAPATAFPPITFWLASLKTHMEWIDFPLLECQAFYNNQKISFSKFQSRFFQNPERVLSGKQFLRKNQMKRPDQEISGKEFMEWALSFWPKEAESHLFDKVLAAFQEIPLEAGLHWKHWVTILEMSLHHQEKEIKPEQRNGMACLSLNAINSVKASHILVMGLSEESLGNYEENSLNQKDWEFLDQELGFPLPFKQGPEKELALQWFFQSSFLKEVVLSFAATNFLGQVQTPSVFFLLFERLQPSTKPLPSKSSETVWDNLKKQKTLTKILPSQSPTPFPHNLKQALQEEKDGGGLPFALNKVSHFSPSSLNEYASCAFMYAARRLFKMKKDPLVDWELSPLEKGSLSHRLLEKLLFENSSLELSETEMEQWIESLEMEEKNLMDEKQKLLTTKTLKSLGKIFLEKEKERREKYPHLKPLAGEQWIECFWNETKGELDHEGTIMFKGCVDRVDFDSKNKSYIILDYKKNLNSKTGVITSWLKNADFQLSLYAQAFEKGLVENREAAFVEAAFYYGLRDFNYKGYVNKAGPYEEMVSRRSGSGKKREEFEKIQENLNALINTLLSHIKQGLFPPQPQDPATCKNCHWRKWCRAKHLN